MSVIEATEQEFSAHPYIIGGSVAALVLIIYLSSRKSSGGQTASFSYNLGPSDANIQAGTQLAIAQLQAQQASAQTAAATTAAGDYFSYLTSNSLNQLNAVQNTNGTALLMNYNNNSTSMANTIQNNNLAQAENGNALAAVENTNNTALLENYNNNSTSMANVIQNDLTTKQGYATSLAIAQL